MADIADVLESLAALVATALYPNGALDSNGQALPSVAGTIVKVMRGTPFAKQLDDDLRAGTVNISINQRLGVGRTTTRLPLEWSTQSIQSPTMTVMVSTDVITLSGTITPNQGVLLIVDGQPYAYVAAASDTLSSVATALASAIQLDRPVQAVGPSLTIPGVRTITVRQIVQGVAIRPTRQQIAGLMVKIYAPSFAVRDTVAAVVDGALAAVSRVTLADGSVAMLRSSGTAYDDRTQKALTFVRSLFYQAEYSTTQTEVETAVAVVEGILSPRAIGGGVGPVVIVTDAHTMRPPAPSDINVVLQSGSVLVDPYGNPEVEI